MESLKTASSFHRYLIALGVGALAFSFSFVNQNLDLSLMTKVFLLLSWLFIVISVAGGLMAEARVVSMMAADNFDINDRALKRPAVAQVSLFGIGIIFMAFALVFIIF